MGQTTRLGAREVAAGKVSRSDLQFDGDTLYWVESRPELGGRTVAVRTFPGVVAPAAGGVAELRTLPADPEVCSPDGVGVRSGVHEYGGASLLVRNRQLYYVDQADQQIHTSSADEPGSEPRQLTFANGRSTRHADSFLVPSGRWVLSVEEEHHDGAVLHRVVATRTDGSGESVRLVDQGGFVAAPRVDPSGSWLVVKQWHHPSMPWERSRLWVATWDESGACPVIGELRAVTPDGDVSVGQPTFMADGGLVYLSDESGWWEPRRVRISSGGVEGVPSVGSPVGLVDGTADYQEPDWVLGQCTVVERPDGSLVARRRVEGRDQLVRLDPGPLGPEGSGWSVTVLAQPCLSIYAVASSAETGQVALCGHTADEAQAVVLWADDRPSAVITPPGPLTRAGVVARTFEPITMTTPHGDIPGLLGRPEETADGPPPLVVFCHGGPTASVEPGLDLTPQFFVQAGLAVALVDYRGSAGHGRAYRQLLNGQWGVADVADCIAYAEALAEAGLVDGRRMAIRGTSSGGMTALAALQSGTTFLGGVAWYGVTDLEALVADTHDFEAHYCDTLIGPWPEAKDRYRERSPARHADRFQGDLLLIQGDQDAVVPLSQAEAMAAAARAAGVDCELLVLPGEGHGFRQPDHLVQALEAELSFYRTLFG